MIKILFAGLTSLLLYSTSAASSTIYTISGSITAGSSDTTLLQYYGDAYGINIGDSMSFEVEVDFTRQGEITNEDGSITYLTDIPLHRNCSTCYGYSSTNYDYATLRSSTFDFSPFSGGQYFNVATSDYHTGMAIDSHSGIIQLSNQLTIAMTSALSSVTSVMIWDWALGDPTYIEINLDDGSGGVYYLGGFSITQIVPVPGAVWLFGSGLLGLAGFMRKKSK